MSRQATMVITCFMNFAVGLVVGTHGPALPELAANTGSSLSALGSFFTAFFLGALVAQLTAGPLTDCFGQHPILLAGLVLLGLGEIGLTTSNSLPLLLASAVLIGLGAAPIHLSIGLLLADLFPHRRSAALNLLNLFFGVGAAAGPAAAGLAQRLWGTTLPVLWMGAVLLALQVPLVPSLAVVERSSQPVTYGAAKARLFRSPALFVFGGVLLLYVGVENSVAGWITVYMERSTEIEASVAALVTAGFWLALTLGRLVAALLGSRLSSEAVLLASLVGSVAGTVLLAYSTGDALLTTTAVALLGLCLGPVYPTVIAITTACFRQATGTVTSIVIASGSLGGMLLPWVQGMLLEQRGSQASSLLLVSAAGAMVLIYGGHHVLHSRRSPIAGAHFDRISDY